MLEENFADLIIAEAQAIEQTEPHVFYGEEPEDSCGDNCTAVFWIKVAFIVICFLEGFLAGAFPTWNTSCRENPKILGIANAFAAGVFIAIALVHVLPEEIEGWNDWAGPGDVFPLPELLAFLGYTLILVLDKVLFDTHALFDDHGDGRAHDPADKKFEQNVRASQAHVDKLNPEASAEEVRASQVEARANMEQGVKDYLNPHDRFAERMKRSLSKQKEGEEGDIVEDQ